jgi:cell wall-associated NlpC family hydrolase
MTIKGASVAYATIGGIVLYSGIKGSSIGDTVRAVLKGNLTVSNTEVLSNPNATAVTAGAVVGSATGSAIAADALKYSGHAYLYGGAPGPDGSRPFDCSSFVSFVLGHDMRMMIPGGAWSSVTDNGSQHGPTTTDYLSWSGASTISASQVQAGDLAVWSTHIGICINNTQMQSALNPTLGTAVTGIINGGPQGEAVKYRRLIAVPFGLS